MRLYVASTVMAILEQPSWSFTDFAPIMATQQQPTTETYTCPDCGSAVARRVGTWECTDCGHVPRHGAD